jgi:nicotinate-nucleotide adenylyltransferase
MERIGLFGGSFNPVHLGHLLMAQAALEETPLHRLFFIPAAQSPFKPEMKMAPPRERARMLRLALAGRPEFEVDEQELARGGVSFSIDTVRDYAARFPASQIFYLIGADHVSQLPLWRDSSELAELVEFIVIPRAGGNSMEAPRPFRSRSLRGFPLGVSSSQIRERVRAGLSIQWLTPEPVREVIANNSLYL